MYCRIQALRENYALFCPLLSSKNQFAKSRAKSCQSSQEMVAQILLYVILSESESNVLQNQCLTWKNGGLIVSRFGVLDFKTKFQQWLLQDQIHCLCKNLLIFDSEESNFLSSQLFIDKITAQQWLGKSTWWFEEEVEGKRLLWPLKKYISQQG